MTTKQTKPEEQLPEWQRPIFQPQVSEQEQQEEAEWLATCSAAWHDPIERAYAEAQAELEARRTEHKQQ